MKKVSSNLSEVFEKMGSSYVLALDHVYHIAFDGEYKIVALHQGTLSLDCLRGNICF